MVALAPPSTTTTTGSRARRSRIVKIAIVASAGALIAMAAVQWKARRHRLPSPSGDPVAIARFTATPKFAEMSLEQKAEYLQTLRTNMPKLVAAAKAGQLTREEQINAVRNGIRIGAQVEMHNYFALPAGPARQAHLDKLINEQEQLRGYASQTQQGGPLKFDSGTQLKQFIESLPPGDRVQMAQFGFELFKRRQERGLPLWPYGP
jgi:hypothetical protein